MIFKTRLILVPIIPPLLKRIRPRISTWIKGKNINNIIINFISIIINYGNQGGPTLKDPLQVPDGPITRSRAKKIKEAMQGLVQSTWDEASKSPTLKMGLKEEEPVLIHLIHAMEDITYMFILARVLIRFWFKYSL